MLIFNLLYKVALGALQAMSIATGLVYTILMCIACQVQKPRNFLISRMIDFSQALWLALQVECGDLDPRGPAFDIHVLDPFFSRPYCHFAKCGIHSFILTILQYELKAPDLDHYQFPPPFCSALLIV